MTKRPITPKSLPTINCNYKRTHKLTRNTFNLSENKKKVRRKNYTLITTYFGHSLLHGGH